MRGFLCLQVVSFALPSARAQQVAALANAGGAARLVKEAAGEGDAVSQLPGNPGGPSMIRPSVVGTSVQVTESDNPADPSHFRAKADDVLASAGSYGDFTRYLQVFPGVVFNSDVSNDLLVRGGNPLENLYLVDGIEVPNINHITSEATTGGLTSMIDTATIGHVDLLTGGYNASYDERLSSVISISPRELGPREESHGEAEVGYVGFGGLIQRPVSSTGTVLLSAHRSLLNLVTSDIGLNGVPTYTNGMAQGDWKLSDRDSVSFLSLNGADSIDINPCANDPFESNLVQTQYSGWRTTNGMRWNRTASPTSTSSLVISDSEQNEHVGQQQQLVGVSGNCGAIEVNPLYPVLYREQTQDGMSILQFDTTLQLTHNLLMMAGSEAKLNRIDYAIEQPSGEQSPLSADPARTDATSFSPHLSTGDTGSYAELSLQLTGAWGVTGGARLQTYALDGEKTLTPRLRTSYRLGEHHSLHAAYGQYAQLPPSVYFFAFPGDRSLEPIRATHFVVGGDLWRGASTRISLEAYRKQYRDYPVSTEYPELSLANEVDTLGQAFIWLPMVSRGRGLTQGVELSAESRFGSHLFLLENVAYAHARFAGLDGVYRAGNFDYPVVANVSGIWRSGAHYEASARYEYTSGRPYTPYLLDASIAQDRGIYDVTQLNAERGPIYSRLDFQVDRITRIAGHDAYLYAGLNNALDRDNFLGYAWEPRCVAVAGCAAQNGAFTSVSQMPIYPNFGVRYIF